MSKTMLMALSVSALMLPACATNQNRGGWHWGGQNYATLEECRAAKRRGAVAGAVGGAATGAILGGNVGETALAAGVGAAGGAVIARGSRAC
jgi:hypothetical protein